MIYIFDKNETLQAVLSNDNPSSCPFWEDVHIQRLNDGVVLHEFQVPANHEDAKLIEINGFTAIRDSNGNFLPFKIRNVEDERINGTLVRRVFAENAGMELLDDIVRPTVMVGVNATQALSSVLAGTRWEVGTVEWTGTKDIEVSGYETVLKVVLDIVNRFGGEVLFRVETDRGKIVKRYVDILQQRGRNEGFGVKRFEYADDILSIKRTESTEDLVTAVIGVGKADSSEKETTFAGVTKSFKNENGSSITKPIGQDWVGDPDALQLWGINGKHRFGVYRNDEETSPIELLNQAWDYLQQVKQPKLTYEMNVVLLRNVAGYEDEEEVHLGDRVTVVDRSFDPPIFVSARIIELELSQSSRDKDKVVLGNYIELEVNDFDVIKQLQQLIAQKQAKWESSGETIHKGDNPPNNPYTNQLWLDTSLVPNVLKRWDGEGWVKASPTEPGDIGAPTPDEVKNMTEAERLRGHKILLLSEKTVIDEKYALLSDHPSFYTQSIKTALINAKDNYDLKYENLIVTIDGVVEDGLVIDTERSSVEDNTEAYRLALSQYEVAYANAEDDVNTGRAADGEKAANEFTQDYFQQKITQGEVPPSNPVTNDLWIDTSINPYVWKQWNGTQWVQLTRANLSDLKGQISAAQIGANVIDSNMITTLGLDAGVIKFGTMSGDRILSNTIGAEKIKTNELVVGQNVAMGSNAYLSWNQILNQPFIPTNADQIGGITTSNPRFTHITSTGIYTGDISAATGTFSGSLSGARGTFAGKLTSTELEVQSGTSFNQSNIFMYTDPTIGIRFRASGGGVDSANLWITLSDKGNIYSDKRFNELTVNAVMSKFTNDVNITRFLTVGNTLTCYGTMKSLGLDTQGFSIQSNGGPIQAGTGGLYGGFASISGNMASGSVSSGYGSFTSLESTGTTRSRGYYADGQGASSWVYLVSGAGVRCATSFAGTSYVPVQASAFTVPSSKREYKTDIKEVEDAYNILKDTIIYEYRLKQEFNILDENDNVIGKKDKEDVPLRYGIMLGEAAPEITNNHTEVDLYSMISLCLKLTKENSARLDELLNTKK